MCVGLCLACPGLWRLHSPLSAQFWALASPDMLGGPHRPRLPDCHRHQGAPLSELLRLSEVWLALARPSGAVCPSGPDHGSCPRRRQARAGQSCRPGPPVWAGWLFVDIAPEAGHWPVSPCVRLGEGRGRGRFLLAGCWARQPRPGLQAAGRQSGPAGSEGLSRVPSLPPGPRGPRGGPSSVSVQDPGHPVWGRGA